MDGRATKNEHGRTTSPLQKSEKKQQKQHYDQDDGGDKKKYCS